MVAAGFPVVATTSVGVAATLGYDDHKAPGDEMLAAAARIARAVEVPVTVDSEAGVDCVYPIGLWETDVLGHFMSEVRTPVNVVLLPQALSLAELAALGVARVSWGPLLYRDAMARFGDQLASLQ
jgi:2-methylisocitrate lyase-like PEP mutase family enzyme